MTHAAVGHHELTEEILGSLARRHSTATVLFHHAIPHRDTVQGPVEISAIAA